MADYGLTNEGVNIKRLDEILDEMHEDLTEEWGVNTRQNPNSLLNMLLTNIADQIAELWELGADVYNSTYPTTAEGMYLDNAAQFAGITREEEAKSYYHILCTGVEGTVIPDTTVIASNTNPVTELTPIESSVISRDTFNQAVIRAITIDGNPITVVLNDDSFSVTPSAGTSQATAFTALIAAITTDDFSAELDSNNNLVIKATAESSSNTMILSDNLTTVTVGCVFTFQTLDYGDIYLPAGSITEILRAVTGLASVVNVGTYIAGRDEETDAEFRSSYLDKIFQHSERMLDSIKSAIMANVQGVNAIAVYENYTNSTDSYGRYPHSIEVVVDGGDDTEIAQQILATKAGGINTYGNVSVNVHGDEEDEITIRFNRPEYVYIWFKVTITRATGQSIPSDYGNLIRNDIVDIINSLSCGDDVIPQESILPSIYGDVSGINYVEILMATGNSSPSTYTDRNLYLTQRQLAKTDSTKIEVVLDE